MRMIVAIRPMRGFSLLELLVAMTLGLFLMSGVISAFVASKQSYAQQDALGQMQENARFALETLARDTRMAGFGGCSNNISVANTVEIGYSDAATFFSTGLTGYSGDDTNSTFPASFKSASSPNTDAVIFHSVSNPILIVKKTAGATVHFTTSDSTLHPGDIVVMVDANCSNMAIFVNTNPPNNDNTANHSVHNTGASPSNCDLKLKGNFTCADTSGAVSSEYSEGSSIYEIESLAYYLGPSSADAAILSLYRQEVSGTSAAEEIVEGVTDLEIFYGLKVSDNVQYLKADGVTAANWVNVQSVRYKITVRSLSLVSGTPVSKTFTKTVKLRNRG